MNIKKLFPLDHPEPTPLDEDVAFRSMEGEDPLEDFKPDQKKELQAHVPLKFNAKEFKELQLKKLQAI